MKFSNGATIFVLFFVVGTCSAGCIDDKLGVFSSATDMKNNGWKIELDNSANNDAVGKKCAKPDNWYGWSGGSAEGKVWAKLEGTGEATLDFGNCWNEPGVVDVYLDDQLIATAPIGEKNVKKTFKYESGSVLKIIDGGDNSVIGLNSLTFTCGACTDGIKNYDETGVDCGGDTCPPCTVAGDFQKFDNKWCSPDKLLATATTGIEEVKTMCAKDSSCAMFYRHGGNSKYYKCNYLSTISPSARGATLYSSVKSTKYKQVPTSTCWDCQSKERYYYLEDAKIACNNDPECLGLYHWDCLGKHIYTCSANNCNNSEKRQLEDGRVFKPSSWGISPESETGRTSCTYRKECPEFITCSVGQECRDGLCEDTCLDVKEFCKEISAEVDCVSPYVKKTCCNRCVPKN